MMILGNSSPWKTMALANSTALITCSKTRIRRENEKQSAKTTTQPQKSNKLGFGATKKSAMEEKWQCVGGCGACCKLDKGPAFPSPEEIFQDSDPSHLQLFKSLVGPDGWCVHYERGSRTCSIYPDRPFFCRVEPDVFRELYGIPDRRFNKEACSACKDTIAAVYGSGSEELKNFNRTVRTAR